MRPPSSSRLLLGAYLLLVVVLMTTSPTPATAQLPARAQDADTAEVAGRLDRFPDDNEVVHTWTWVLAPLWSKGRSAVRVGYGFEVRDAESSTRLEWRFLEGLRSP